MTRPKHASTAAERNATGHRVAAVATALGELGVPWHLRARAAAWLKRQTTGEPG